MWKLYWHIFICDIFFLYLIGFEFSDSEPSALVQRQGGPCAVIAPVQAFLLKTILSEVNSQNLSTVSINIFFPVCTSIQVLNMHNSRDTKELHFNYISH